VSLIIADRVLEASTTTGTGVFTLTGAVLGYRTFASVCAVADTLWYYIEGVDSFGKPSGEYEYGLGTYSAANTLTRTTVRGSSNGGAAVNFTTGAKLVGIGVLAPSSVAVRTEWLAALGAAPVGAYAASGANADITSFANAVTGQTAARGDDSTKLATTAYVVDATPQIQPVTASIAANALSVFLDPTQLDFRSSALGAAAINRRTVGSQISVVVSSGSTLGTFNGVKNRLVVLAIDAAGTVELAVCNIAYNSALDETQTIDTVAEGGAGTADSATVIYSTTARSGVPFRIVGYIESTQATAGTWATAPSLVQGAGGNAARQHMSVGYHQAWTSVTRTVGTTYYNDTGRPIILSVHGAPDTSYAYIIATVGGTTIGGPATASSTYTALQVMIPAGQTYSWSMSAGTLSNITCRELR